MAIYLLKNADAKSAYKTNQLVVAAETAADAKVFAATHFGGTDSSWADSTATALAETTLDASASMLGYVWTIVISGAAGQTVNPIEVTTTGTGTDDLDAIAADLVTALNAETDIANAAYAAPNLTLSSIADGIGDGTVTVIVHPPSGDTNANLASLFTGTITDGGIAGAALVVALVADTEITPTVLAEA